jgi:hypothetical protein
MAEGKSPERREAHLIFKAKDAPKFVRVNTIEGAAKDIATDDAEEMAAHGIVACSNCGAPNHVMQLTNDEPPWVQCGCNGRRTEVTLSKRGRDFVKMTRDRMIEAVNAGRGVPSRG